MALTQSQIAANMLAQLRLLDPSVSAEVGTPERKIIDTVAQANTDSQIDLVGLQSALDIDSKYGTDLDKFLAIFGFGRTSATYAEGFVTFSRNIISNFDIIIPAQTIVQVAQTDENQTPDLGVPTFYTTFAVTLTAGSISTNAPIRCTFAGTIGNVAANTINSFTSSPVLGVTSVTNIAATTGGLDQESDAEFKVRFKNTVFRNLAGTEDQYLALAIATAYTSKANVVGPVSLYREYIQVPPVDDASSYDVNGDSTPDVGGGNSGEYTTALSTIPYAKKIYDLMPVYISDGSGDINSTFYRPGVDFRMNVDTSAKDFGDTKRLSDTSLGPDVTDISALDQPNFTLMNVYTGTDPTVMSIRPNDILLAEYNYLSDSSRNNPDLGVTNAVDVFIDGGNNTLASTVLNRPWTTEIFINNPGSKYYYENFRRVGQPDKRPTLGNAVSILYWQPVVDLPDQIIIGVNTYTKNIHYWPVEDITDLHGTTRSRGGIEWSVNQLGQLDQDPDEGPYTGLTIFGLDQYTAVEIDNYTYDRNIADLQGSLDNARQITTDVLAHKIKTRYFKFDVTVMYSPGVSQGDTNLAVQIALSQYLSSQNFGTTVQLSDILQTIHNVSGIDNVRWSNDVPGSTNLIRAFECDINGLPRLNVTNDVIRPGGAFSEQQGIYITGQPTGGTWKINGGGVLNYNDADTDIQSSLRATTGNSSITVTEDSRPIIGVTEPIRSFVVDYVATGAQTLPTIISNITGGPTVFDNDFFIKDNELVSLPLNAQSTDTLPGLIIRARAQNTWTR